MIKNIVYIIALLLSSSVLEVSAADLSREDIKNIASQIQTEDRELLRSANTLLLDAIKNNDMQGAEQAILQGASLSGFLSREGEVIVPLIVAVAVQSDDIVRFLVAMGADIDQQDQEGNTALLQAAHDKNMVQLLLDLNADINVVDKNGITALMLPALEGSADIVQLLINAKADLNAKNMQGGTALLIALAKGHCEVAKLLIGAGADINIADNDGTTPLSYVLRYNLEEIKCAMKEKILENIEKTTNIEDRIALEDQLKQLD